MSIPHMIAMGISMGVGIILLGLPLILLITTNVLSTPWGAEVVLGVKKPLHQLG